MTPTFRIDELADLVHPRDGHRKVLAMIDAYLDESGIHGGAKICIIAGYFGGRGQWKRFEASWKVVLRDFKVPLEEFHAKDLMKRVGFFKEWTDATHRSFLKSLATSIVRYKIHPVSQAVVVNDFNSFSLFQRRFLTGAKLKNGKLVTSGCPSKSYFMPFQLCARRVASYAPVGGKAHFFFGLDRPFAEYATSLFRLVKSQADAPYRDRLGDPSFPLAKDTPQLQAADFLVHLTYLYLLEKLEAEDANLQPCDTLKAILQRVIVRDEDLVYADKMCIMSMLLAVPRAELKGQAALELIQEPK